MTQPETIRLNELPAAVDREAESALVRSALDNPIESPSLEEQARGKHNICIITSDHTRPVPSGITMPILLERIRTGNPEARTGNLDGNPLHKDMLYAAETAGLAFILNVVLDEEKRIVHAVSGQFDYLVEALSLPGIP